MKIVSIISAVGLWASLSAGSALAAEASPGLPHPRPNYGPHAAEAAAALAQAAAQPPVVPQPAPVVPPPPAPAPPPPPAPVAPPPPPAPPQYPNTLDGWIAQAFDVLVAHGYQRGSLDPVAVRTMALHESSGNPNAINNWDSNAVKGTPSKGVLQVIDPTFRTHALPGYGNIWNPVHNIIAGVRYSISRYGSLAKVPGVKAMRAGGAYRGY
ncbi:lytic transglycosylase domain-containing protein [Streptoalloteichus hindustanus]|uniref:Transglycosylase SLT domain-containing protein n=1 Tax=Streptoalloteichus hindustanus TaxID=2017 RepID=A0A1M4VNW3_STRHI|nr:transglycosylase SLT domain-containing protein [Streptoalloteichus hindustanus]SHE70492.1 Transglycosylase SLT domain-containing protein [Streptoalloteichus hindustanus]